jgi:hypothetical protein
MLRYVELGMWYEIFKDVIRGPHHFIEKRMQP